MKQTIGNLFQFDLDKS